MQQKIEGQKLSIDEMTQRIESLNEEIGKVCCLCVCVCVCSVCVCVCVCVFDL